MALAGSGPSLLGVMCCHVAVGGLGLVLRGGSGADVRCSQVTSSLVHSQGTHVSLFLISLGLLLAEKSF